MSQMKLLDLFCGAGGAGYGYHLAGFDVVGVDINPQANYPFEFVQGDALEYLKLHGNEFDFIHASPPCQRFSQMGQWNRDKSVHPDFIEPIRKILIELRKPYVIENVPKSPLINPVVLCGSMFGLGVIRHRLFECSFELSNDRKCNHTGKFYTVLTKSCRPSGDMFAKSSVANGRVAMQADWMTQREMGESIPPAYTKFIGEWWLANTALLSNKACSGQEPLAERLAGFE
jgi:DNA (cytosine-5)-methyltransferase 1